MSGGSSNAFLQGKMVRIVSTSPFIRDTRGTVLFVSGAVIAIELVGKDQMRVYPWATVAFLDIES